MVLTFLGGLIWGIDIADSIGYGGGITGLGFCLGVTLAGVFIGLILLGIGEIIRLLQEILNKK